MISNTQLAAYHDGVRATPPNSLGFGSEDVLKEIREELFATRAAGLNVSFEQFLSAWTFQKLHDTSGTGTAKRIQEGAKQSQIDLAAFKVGAFGQPSADEQRLMGVFLQDVGIEALQNVKVSHFISTTPGMRGIFTELIRKALITGIGMAPIYPKIVSSTQAAGNGPVIILPTANVLPSTPENVGEAATFPLAAVSFAQRSVNMKKFGLALRVTDEAIRYCSFDLFSIILTRQGVKLGMVYDSSACAVILNGDQVTGTMAPAVVGVAATEDGFTYADWLHVCLRMGCVGMVPNTIVTGLTEAEAIMKLSEFREPLYLPNANTLMQVTFTNLPGMRATQLLVKSNYPAHTITILDSTAGITENTGRPFLLERDRDILNETNLAKFSEEKVFSNTFREAVVTVKTDQERTGDYTFDNADYIWMVPHDAIPIE